MKKAESGNTVQVHYRGTLNDGSEFDCSAGRDPLEFTIGKGMVIKGFDNAVTGMAVGDKKTVRIPCAEAYGKKNDELIVTMERARLPKEFIAEVGQHLRLMSPEGKPLVATVSEVRPDAYILDANHPLAGEDLTFEIELVGLG